MPLSRFRLFALAGLLAGATACEPADVTAARDQLGRGGRPPVQLTVPIRIDPESLAFRYGEQLAFTALQFDPFQFDYGQMLRTAPLSTSLGAAFGPPAIVVADTLRFQTDAGSRVVGGTVTTGVVVRDVTNGTSCDVTVMLAVTDSTGAVVATFPAIVVPAGMTAGDTVSLNGASFAGFVAATADVDPGLCVPVLGEVATVDVTFPPVLFGQVQLEAVDESFTDTYQPLASESRLQAVDTVTVASGTFTATVENRLPVPLDVTVTLDGITIGGTPLMQAATVPAAAGGGAGVTLDVVFDLAGATILPGSTVATVTGRAQAAAVTVSGAETDQAVTISGGGDLVVGSLAGDLDPALTPELIVAVSESDVVSAADADFGDLEEIIRDVTVDSATLIIDVDNSAAVPLRVAGLAVGIVPLDGAGQPLLLPGGGFAFETDGAGAPLLIRLADPGSDTLTVARQATRSLSFAAEALADRLVRRLNDGQDMALVAEGVVNAGDGQPARAVSADQVQVRFQFAVHRLVYQRGSGGTP